MTPEEIDKWVEDHMKWESDSEYPVLFIKIVQWSKDIAHKFYDIGWNEGFDACKKSLNVD